jgi:hypothetical protein
MPAQGVGDGGEKQPGGEQVFGTLGTVDRIWLMPARNPIPSPAQILRQIHFHLGCGFRVADF